MSKSTVARYDITRNKISLYQIFAQDVEYLRMC